MNQTERLYKIETLLKQRKVVSFADLLTELEISPATLKRDLAYLRDRLYAPVLWSRSRGGYCLERSVSDQDMAQTGSAPQRQELPGLWFSQSEIYALLAMHQLLAGLDAGKLLAPHIAPLTDRLNALLGGAGAKADEASVAAEQVRRRVRIIGLAHRAVQARHFQRTGSALLQRKRLLIDYKARGTGETSQREISPLRLVHYRENWYLDAWCHLRNGLRNFAVDAILNAHMLDVPATEISDAELDASQLVTDCHQLKMPAADGKRRLTDVATAETLLRLVQSVPSPKAEPIKLWLAKVGYERMQEMADPALSLDRARQTWQQHGRSDKWIQQRMTGQEPRNKLTDYWSEHEIKKGSEFAILTNIIHQEWAGTPLDLKKGKISVKMPPRQREMALLSYR